MVVVKKIKVTKKEDAVKQEDRSYWDWLPLELQTEILNKAAFATAHERIQNSWGAIHNEMEGLPKCQLFWTVLTLNCFKDLLLSPFSVCWCLPGFGHDFFSSRIKFRVTRVWVGSPFSVLSWLLPKHVTRPEINLFSIK